MTSPSVKTVVVGWTMLFSNCRQQLTPEKNLNKTSIAAVPTAAQLCAADQAIESSFEMKPQCYKPSKMTQSQMCQATAAIRKLPIVKSGRVKLVDDLPTADQQRLPQNSKVTSFWLLWNDGILIQTAADGVVVYCVEFSSANKVLFRYKGLAKP
jgi:hypothetical protein